MNTLKDKYAVYRLLSGEEIVTKVLSDNFDSVTINQPLLILLSEDKVAQNGVKLQLVPWSILNTNENINLQKQQIVYSYEINSNNQLLGNYTRILTMINNRLVVPQGPSLMKL